MVKKYIIIIVFLIIFTMIISGCTDLFYSGNTGITYESHPTKVSFTISYGYLVECKGSGNYEINYDCDSPSVLKGEIGEITVHNNDYNIVTIASYNNIYRWRINSNKNTDYNLGLTVDVISESYLVSDLTGANSLTIDQIRTENQMIASYPYNAYSQYCRAQSNGTVNFIDPNNPEIIDNATEIYNNSGTDNAFIVAKDLFIWLKQKTSYQIHSESNDVQPASFTLQCRTGDCDDLSFLYISLCRSIGIPARFIRGILIDKNEAIPHAWVEVYVGGNIGKDGWIPVECAGTSNDPEVEVNQNFGVESAGHLRLFKDDGSNESLIASLSGISYRMFSMNRDISSQSITQVVDFTELISQELNIDNNGYRSYQ